MSRTATFHNYCDAVERDGIAHPIQKASIVIPEGVFLTAGQLYDYSVCSYDAAGTPLLRTSLAREAAWVIFDNVYIRTSGGRAPTNANRALGRAAGFVAKGGPRNPERAAELWRRTVEHFGSPGAIKREPSGDRRSQDPEAPRPEQSAQGPSKRPSITAEDGDSPPHWAIAVVKECRELWEQLEGEYPFWRSGFNVFYSPIHLPARVVIIGANPGGGPDVFDVGRASSIPTVHEYLRYDYPMARRMRDLFTKAGDPEVLERSMKLNLNFFRSRDLQEWLSAPVRTRLTMEQFSQRKVQEILERLTPRIVLSEGMATFDRLAELLMAKGAETVVRSGTSRAYARARLPGEARLVGIVHPTGARYSAATWQRVAEALRSDLQATRLH